jgi:hypothetical protein
MLMTVIKATQNKFINFWSHCLLKVCMISHKVGSRWNILKKGHQN